MPLSCGSPACIEASPEASCCPGSRSHGTLHVFVSSYQRETSGSLPAASHLLLCPDSTCLSAAAWAQPSQLCAARDSAAFFILSFKSFILVITSAQHHQADMWKPHRCCVVGSAGTASFPLLYLTTLISLLTTLFPSQETTEVVSLFTTCLQEIWVLLLSGMLVLLPSIEKGFADLFLTLQTQTPPLSVRCFHLRFSLTKTLGCFLQTIFKYNAYHIRFISAGGSETCCTLL